MKRKLCILHWMPVELFPPAMNTVAWFARQDDWTVSLCTNRNHLGWPAFAAPALRVVRGLFPTGRQRLGRWWSYASFHLKSLAHLLRHRPDVVLYFEPHSAWPVFAARLVLRRFALFIHYHEYHQLEDYRKPGMRMAGRLHRIERRRLYPVASWISQTNRERLQMFLADHPEVDPGKGQLLANYPPAAWWHRKNIAWARDPQAERGLRLVYVGALSKADTWIEPVVEWVVAQAPRMSLDLYCYNMDAATRDWLRGVCGAAVRLHDQGVPYARLPQLLCEYHLGLILYRGNTPNYMHNATNKLFEYLACGLDVFYPAELAGVRAFRSSDRRPRVVECDFSKLPALTYSPIGRQQLPASPARYDCESELARLAAAMRVASEEMSVH